jgi:hypothetical protein
MHDRPTNTAITFRAASPDVIHGCLIERANVNTMPAPGYVSTIAAVARVQLQPFSGEMKPRAFELRPSAPARI